MVQDVVRNHGSKNRDMSRLASGNTAAHSSVLLVGLPICRARGSISAGTTPFEGCFTGVFVRSRCWSPQSCMAWMPSSKGGSIAFMPTASHTV